MLNLKTGSTIYDMSSCERYIIGPKIHKVDSYINKVLGLKVFRNSRKVMCKFYMHYNPCIYTDEYTENIFKMSKLEILPKIKSKVIKVGWKHQNTPDQVLWYFKMIKTRKPINVIAMSAYLGNNLVTRALFDSIQVIRGDQLWLQYTLNKEEMNDNI